MTNEIHEAVEALEKTEVKEYSGTIALPMGLVMSLIQVLPVIRAIAVWLRALPGKRLDSAMTRLIDAIDWLISLKKDLDIKD